MSISYYDIGDVARVVGTFQQQDGTFVDPSTVTFTFTKPNNAPVTYVYGTDAQLVKDAVGKYHVDLAIDTSGMWPYKYAGSGNFASVQFGQLLVSGSLVVENGQGLANADSYISVAAADIYHSTFGNTTWFTLNTTQKENALREAAIYMRGVYRLRWKGYRRWITQALDWPRIGVPIDDLGFAGILVNVASDIVPTEVQQACAELAVRAASGELAPDLDRFTTREKVGPIEVDYLPGGVQYKRYRQVDLLLKIYLKPAQTDLVRQ